MTNKERRKGVCRYVEEANDIMKRDVEHTLARERSHQRHQHTNTGLAKALRGTEV